MINIREWKGTKGVAGGGGFLPIAAAVLLLSPDLIAKIIGRGKKTKVNSPFPKDKIHKDQ